MIKKIIFILLYILSIILLEAVCLVWLIWPFDYNSLDIITQIIFVIILIFNNFTNLRNLIKYNYIGHKTIVVLGVFNFLLAVFFTAASILLYIDLINFWLIMGVNDLMIILFFINHHYYSHIKNPENSDKLIVT